MRRPPYLTDHERAAIQALLVDRLVVRCRDRDEALDELLRSGLAIPEVALPSVRASARQDDDELRRLVARYVTGLADLRLIEELRRNEPDTRSLERLGFDPFDAERAQAYLTTSRLLNGRQIVLAAVAGIVVGLMLLFPPWQEVIREKRTAFIVIREKSVTLESRHAGYAFLLAPPKAKTLEHGPNDRALYGDRWLVQEYWVDLRLLGLQLAGALSATGVIVWLLRTPAYRAEDFDRTAKGP